jgi:hypothetical protein
MLGNVVPLWEVMLAAIKLGAVIIPASTLLQADDLVDRVERGDVRHVVAEQAQVPKFAHVPGSWTRVVVGAAEGTTSKPKLVGHTHASYPVGQPRGHRARGGRGGGRRALPQPAAAGLGGLRQFSAAFLATGIAFLIGHLVGGHVS